mgnify:CR=1 FL=1
MQFKNLELEWLGHAGVLIKSNKLVLVIDPYQTSADEKADFVLITHSHYDHCSIGDIGKIVKNGTTIVMTADCQSKINKLKNNVDMRIIEPGKEINLQEVKIKAVHAYNLNKQFHPKSEGWNGYVIEVGGIKIYHAGDSDLIPEMLSLGKIDVAFLPVGGTYTMNFREAANAAVKIKPQLAVPIHWGNIVGTKEDALKFVELCEHEGISARVLE